MSIEVIPPGEYEPDELDARMLWAVQLLCAGKTMVEAAEIMGTTDRTLRRWKGDERFQVKMRQLQSDMMDAARNMLRSDVRHAVEVVRQIRTDGSGKGDPTRLAAALATLKMAGVEVETQQAEGVRRILTRVPREVVAPAQVVQEPAAPAQVIAEDRPAHRIITRH